MSIGISIHSINCSFITAAAFFPGSSLSGQIIIFSNSKVVRIIDNIKNANKPFDAAKDIPLEKESKFSLLHFLTISELIEIVDDTKTPDPATNEIVQSNDNKDIKDQSSGISKKAKYKITRKLSSGISMSYKEERDLPDSAIEQEEVVSKENEEQEEVVSKENTIIDLEMEYTDEDKTEILSSEQNKK